MGLPETTLQTLSYRLYQNLDDGVELYTISKVGINYNGAIRSGRSLSSMGNDVERLRTNAKTLTDNIPSGYDGLDARTYMNAVEQLRDELKTISNELGNIGNDIIDVANQIRREEEEEELRRREAVMRSLTGTY